MIRPDCIHAERAGRGTSRCALGLFGGCPTFGECINRCTQRQPARPARPAPRPPVAGFAPVAGRRMTRAQVEAMLDALAYNRATDWAMDFGLVPGCSCAITPALEGRGASYNPMRSQHRRRQA